MSVCVCVCKIIYDSVLCQIVEAVLKECKKEKPAYKIEAVKCLGEILETYKLDRFADVWEIVNPVIQKVAIK